MNLDEFNIENIMDIIDDRRYKLYEFYTKNDFEMNFQEVIDNQLEYSIFSKNEIKIINFIKSIDIINNSFEGYVTSSVYQSIRIRKAAKFDNYFYKILCKLEDEGKINKVNNLDKKNITNYCIIATRGIGQIAVFYPLLSVIIYLSDLHGIIIFLNDINNKIIDVARTNDLYIAKV